MTVIWRALKRCNEPMAASVRPETAGGYQVFPYSCGFTGPEPRVSVAAMQGDLVGREAELGVATEFLDRLQPGPTALLIRGEPGIGKSALWLRVVAAASDRGLRVLTARPAQAEAQLAFAGLADLLDPAADEVLPALPAPQRTALAVALLREEPRDRAVDQRAVSAAALSALRLLATASPVLVAVDDLHWLDRPSAAVLEFAARRVESMPIGLLACIRPDTPTSAPTVADAWPADRLTRLDLQPLSLAAIHEILKAALGRPLPRRVVTRIQRVAAGNAFYALELARTLGDPPRADDAVQLPDDLRELVAARIAGLPTSVRAALLAVAAQRAATVDLVSAATGGSRVAAQRALHRAQDAGIVVIDGSAVRFVHPLFAAGVYATAPATFRQRVHRRLAALVEEREERAQHLALATPAPDPQLAADLDDAAESARARGAPEAAAELVEAARRLTPTRLTADAQRRAVRAAEYHFHAGELARARELLDGVLRQQPVDAVRAEALRTLAEIHYHELSLPEAIRLFEEALEYTGSNRALRSSIELHLAFAANAAGNWAAAEPHARNALNAAEQLQDWPVVAEALAVTVILEYLLGRGLDERRLMRALELEDPQRQTTIEMRPTLIAAHLMLYEGRLERSRDLFLALRLRVIDRGEESDLPFPTSYLVWAETMRGDLVAASRYADEALASAVHVGMDTGRCWALAFGALCAGYAGDVQATRRAAEEALALAPTTGVVIAAIWARWGLAVLALSQGDAAAADAALDTLTRSVESAGIAEPIRCAYLSDHIEALIALGQFERADRLTVMLEEAGERHARDWVRHQAGRCRALLFAAAGNLDAAARAVDDALEIGHRIEHRLDYARTLLVSAQIERRRRRRATARHRCDQAATIFEQGGARLWAERARDEQLRTAARPGGAELTDTERRVAELASSGHTNRQVAAALFVSPKTVEANLARIYAKLGIHSRAELGSLIGAGRESPDGSRAPNR